MKATIKAFLTVTAMVVFMWFLNKFIFSPNTTDEMLYLQTIGSVVGYVAFDYYKHKYKEDEKCMK